MKNLLIYILFLFSIVVFSQKRGIVIDSSTNKGIAYINIWVENDNIGATTNRKGEFFLKTKDTSKTIVFSGIGYETKKIKIKDLTDKIKLKQIITELIEVEIHSKKETKEFSIDKFNKSKYHFYWSTNGIIAKYFPYKEEYNKTPILKSIKVLTKSKVKNAKFNIRLYTKGKDGKPEYYLHNKNILVHAKKGKKYTNVDISELNIQFPKNGFFIGIEWLIIESNKDEYTYTMSGSKKKYKGVHYNPSIGIIPTETINMISFRKGKWHEYSSKNKRTHPFKKYRNKYNQLAIELILTN